MRVEEIGIDKGFHRAVRALGLEIAQVLSVPQSFSSEVYRVVLTNGERAILKIPFNEAKLYREQKILELLQGQMPVPRILDFWEGDEEIPGAFLLSELPGHSMTDLESQRLAYELGEMLARFHSIPVDRFGCLLKPMDEEEKLDWRGEFLGEFDRFVSGAEKCLEPWLFQKAVDWFEEHFAQLPEPAGPCLTHRDYRPGNILVEAGQISGLLDFESSRGGLADMDFTKMKIFLWDPYPEAKEPFLAGYRGIRPLPKLEQTLPFYFFINAFGGVNWCYQRNQVGGEFYQTNLAQLKEILGVE